MFLVESGYFIIGLTAGILSGMFGIGGGIVIVPALLLFFHLDQTVANGTSLAALLLPVGILAVIEYYKQRLIDIRAALLIGMGISAGIVLGSETALFLPGNILRKLYALFLLYMCYQFLDVPTLLRKICKLASDVNGADRIVVRSVKIHQAFLIGLLAGLLAGLFGIGGGIVIVPLLFSIFKYPYQKAVGTSLCALLLPVGLPGVIIYHQAGAMNFKIAVLIGLGLTIGALGGAKLALNLPPNRVKKLYGLFLLYVVVYLII